MAPFMINKFRNVGFANPYPDDDKSITGSIDEYAPGNF